MTNIRFVLAIPVILLVMTYSADERTQSNSYPVCEVIHQASHDVIITGQLIQSTSQSEDGALLISGTLIKEIGDAATIRQSHLDATIIDCGKSYISPGFINPHEHLDHSGGTPDPNTAPIYEHRDEWRGQIGDKYAVEFHSVSVESRNIWIELRHLFAGTTILASSGGVSELVKNANSDHELADYAIEYEIFPFGFVSIFHDPSATTDDIRDASLRVIDDPQLNDQPYVAHVAEGINETATIEGYAFMESVMKNPGRRYSLIHGVALDYGNFPALKESDVTLIWSPRSNVALYNATANVPAVLDADGRVALSTDWSFSGSYNLLEEIRCADHIDNEHWDNRLKGKDYWHMITDNAAYALGLEKTTGRIEPNFAADLVVMRNHTGDFYEDLLIADVDDVLLTIVEGEIKGGHTDALTESALPPSCKNIIDSHFFCFEWNADNEAPTLSLEQLLEENQGIENVVPLFSTETQVACKIDPEIEIN